MDIIWDRKSFEVGGHWPLWQGWKKKWPCRTDKSRMLKIKNNKIVLYLCMILSPCAFEFKYSAWKLSNRELYPLDYTVMIWPRKQPLKLCGYKQAELCDKCPIILSQFAVTDIKTRNISQGNYSWSMLSFSSLNQEVILSKDLK